MKALTKDQIEVDKIYKIINNIKGSPFIKGDLVKVYAKYPDSIDSIDVIPVKVFDKGLMSKCHPRIIQHDRLGLHSTTIKDIAEEILSLQEIINNTTLQIKDLQKKQNWMLKNNITEFSEDEYEVFEALTIIESKISKMEKVKALTSLIKK